MERNDFVPIPVDDTTNSNFMPPELHEHSGSPVENDTQNHCEDVTDLCRLTDYESYMELHNNKQSTEMIDTAVNASNSDTTDGTGLLIAFIILCLYTCILFLFEKESKLNKDYQQIEQDVSDDDIVTSEKSEEEDGCTVLSDHLPNELDREENPIIPPTVCIVRDSIEVENGGKYQQSYVLQRPTDEIDHVLFYNFGRNIDVHDRMLPSGVGMTENEGNTCYYKNVSSENESLQTNEPQNHTKQDYKQTNREENENIGAQDVVTIIGEVEEVHENETELQEIVNRIKKETIKDDLEHMNNALKKNNLITTHKYNTAAIGVTGGLLDEISESVEVKKYEKLYGIDIETGNGTVDEIGNENEVGKSTYDCKPGYQTTEVDTDGKSENDDLKSDLREKIHGRDKFQNIRSDEKISRGIGNHHLFVNIQQIKRIDSSNKSIVMQSDKDMNSWMTCQNQFLEDVDYKVVEKLGQGGYGQTYRCQLLPRTENDSSSIREVAMKVVPPQKFKETEILVPTLMACISPQVINIFGVVVENGDVKIFMELAKGGTIDEACNEWNDKAIMIAIYQILTGLRELHENGFVHGDIKAANVVLKTEDKDPMNTTLIDFGLAKIDSPDYRLNTKEFTLRCLPPEWKHIFNLTTFDSSLEAMDMWQVGCLLFQILFQKMIWRGAVPHNPNNAIYQSRFRDFIASHEAKEYLTRDIEDNLQKRKNRCHPVLQKLLLGLLETDKSQRLTCGQALGILRQDVGDCDT